MPTPLTKFLPAGDRALPAGDREAFAALYDRLAVCLYRTALTMLASTAEAEDVVHDLFVDLARNRQKLAGVTDLDGYVFTMLRHAVGRRHRRESFARRSIDRLGQEHLDAGGFSMQPTEIEDEALAAAVASPPIAQREVITLKIDGGLTFAEIAAPGLIGRCILPGISSLFEIHYRAKARKLALAAVVEATRKRLETGSLPEVLPSMPRDPFTEGDHSKEAEPLVWKRADGRLTVYSVGPDGEDDGGPAGPGAKAPEGNDDVGLSIAL